MNFDLTHLPERPEKPRTNGMTMVMDKGLSVRQAENFMNAGGDLTDYVKLGFGTAYLTKDIEAKIKVYKEGSIRVYLGGTLFEAFLIRNMLDDYQRLVEKLKLDTIEVSDGSIVLDHDKKCEIISRFSKNFQVLSEVGSKEEGILISPGKWISMMDSELSAGSSYVIAEARESGNVGIYRPSGTAHVALVNKILAKIPSEKILWEAPMKSQQVWFIKLLGANVNLGNINHFEVIPLETLRLGLRGDTFFTFLPKGLTDQKS
jgi:phosphosulfolactate synthase